MMYHSAFSYNRLDLGVANTMLYEPIITAYPCETDTLGYPMLLICLYYIWCISVVLYIST